MIYICHKPYTGTILSASNPVTIPRGEQFETINNYIVTSNKGAIFAITSDKTFRHFARNDDGMGLVRGDITYQIAYADREVSWEEEVETVEINEETGEPVLDAKGEPVTKLVKMQMTGRIKPAEVELIRKDYPQFLRSDAVIFTKDFFDADVNVLKELTEKMNNIS